MKRTAECTRRLMLVAVWVSGPAAGRLAGAGPGRGGDGRPTVIADYDDQDDRYNQLGGRYGVFGRIQAAIDTTVTRGGSEASLRVQLLDLTSGSAGVFNSLLGDANFREFVFDLTPWEYLRLHVRGAGQAGTQVTVRVEIKEGRLNANEVADYTAFSEFSFDGGDPTWQPVVLDLDFTNQDVWTLNRFLPNPARIKEMVLVLESSRNVASAAFYLDDIELLDTDAPAGPLDPAVSDETFLAHVLDASLSYFLNAVHPTTGMVADRLSFSHVSSVAGTGFGLAAWAVAAETGRISRDEAFTLTERALRTLATKPMGSFDDPPEPRREGQIGFGGFFYHFLEMRTATREVSRGGRGQVLRGSELSPVDTTLCLYGVMASRQAITTAHGYTPAQEASVRGWADAILDRVDWPSMLAAGRLHRVYASWKPEMTSTYAIPHPSGNGFLASTGSTARTWDWTTDEVLLIALAGLAAPDPSRRYGPRVLQGFTRRAGSFAGHTMLTSFFGSAFTYEFGNAWLPLRTLGCDTLGTDWWENARSALRANRAFCRSPAAMSRFDTFDGISFGVTACEDASRRYHGFGAPPAPVCTGSDAEVIACFLEDRPDKPNRTNGTVAVYGAGAAVGLLTDEAIAALRHYYFDLGLWHELYGFPDSFHLNPLQLVAAEGEVSGTTKARLQALVGTWSNPVQFAINQGPMVLALANELHDGLVQKWVASYPQMRRALDVAFPTQGDADGDCDVDLSDYTELQACFTGPGVPAPPGCDRFDADADDDIDLADLVAFQVRFTGPR